MIDLEKLREVMIDLRDKDYNHGASPAEVLELLDHIAQLEKYESKLITERDHRDDVIDRMADAVLGSDRHEWTSAYDIDDAAEEVEQRIAQLEKDAARWRFLCEKYDVSLLTTFFGNGCINKKIDDVNRAIDTARKA